MDAPFEHKTEAELREQIAAAQRALDQVVAKRARQTLKEARRLAAEVGYEAEFRKVGKTAGVGKAAGARAKVAPKYRNPNNPEETWSGRGRQPKWMQQLQAEGTSMDELAIESAA
ncbi:MAG: H-NS histone family protein [Thiobacillus sp.]